MYEILETLQFTSERSCMSVLVRRPDGKLVLYCKGSDEVLLEKLATDAENGACVHSSHVCCREYCQYCHR